LQRSWAILVRSTRGGSDASCISSRRRHPPILQRQQPAIGNRHAVRVPRQVLQDLWGAAESGLTVHHPIWPTQGGHEIGEAGGVSRCAKSVRSIRSPSSLASGCPRTAKAHLRPGRRVRDRTHLYKHVPRQKLGPLTACATLSECHKCFVLVCHNATSLYRFASQPTLSLPWGSRLRLLRRVVYTKNLTACRRHIAWPAVCLKF
jgi:hypothetical protein